MKNQLLKEEYNSTSIKLLLIHFVDENNIHFIYSPHLDLTGYGNGVDEAKNSFETVFQDFIDYTVENKTLSKVLNKLGWQAKSPEGTERLFAPSIISMIKDNEHVSEILDTYPVSTYHREVDIPAYM